MPIAAHLLLHTGQLPHRAAAVQQLLTSCTLCPRQCRVNRLVGESGFCRTGARARIASYGPHYGEESPLVGRHGSGAIFFAGCNLGCCFCQNFEISQGDAVGEEVSAAELAAIMLELQNTGCHNINLVTPSHAVPQMLEALIPALEAGLHIPLVFNCSGYESLETLTLLDGVVDIYLPDAKFWQPATAARYTGAADYPQRMREALIEMQRQVGTLVVDAEGCARSGLMIRHLLMPGLLEETKAILHFIAQHLPPDTFVNIMAQCHPCGRAGEFTELRGAISPGDYQIALDSAHQQELNRLDQPNLGRLLRQLGW